MADEELPSYADVEHETFNIGEYIVQCQLPESVPVPVPVSPADTVEQLKERIFECLGIPVKDQVLYLQDEKLFGSRSISDLGVKDGSLVRVFQKTANGTAIGPGIDGQVTIDLSQEERENGESNTDGDEAEDGEAAPPSYRSVTEIMDLGRVLGGEEQAGGRRRRAWIPIIIALTIVLGTIALWISMIVVGAVYECRTDRRIKDWLITTGSLSLASLVIDQYVKASRNRARARGQDPNEAGFRHGCLAELTQFLQTFMVVWLIVGSAWVYGCGKECRDGCDKPVFDLAFWTITSIYILVLVILVVVPCATACIAAASRDRR